jgi:putative addiction module component
MTDTFDRTRESHLRFASERGFEQADEFKRLWIEEALRRRDEISSGKVKPIPGTEVMAEIRRITEK